MKKNNIISIIYPVLFIFPLHAFGLMMITMHRFDWPNLKAAALAGIAAGIIAEILIVKYHTDLKKAILKLFVVMIFTVAFWILGYIILHFISSRYLEWGWWYSSTAEIINKAILLAPVFVSTIMFLISEKNKSDKIVMALINPAVHICIEWYVFDTLLSCLPT